MNNWDWYDYEKVKEFNHKRSLQNKEYIRLIQTSSNSRSKKRCIGKKQRNLAIAGFNGMAFP